MTNVRALGATILLIFGLFQLLDLWLVGFSWASLAIASVSFLLSYWVWPSKRDDPKHRYQHSQWFDWLEFLIELPVEIVLWLIRSLFGLLRRSVDDVDIIP